MATIARAGQSPVRWELSVETFQHQAQPEASLLPMQLLGTLSDLPSQNLTSKTGLFISFSWHMFIAHGTRHKDTFK